MRIWIGFLFVFFLHADDVITHHTIELEHAPFSYQAVVGSLPILNQKEEKTGDFFYTAYIKDPLDSERPITFAFNGGPGSSSVWLHMGVFGPKRVLGPEEGQLPCPPYEIVENPETILDLTDIVFIDPISTGFSKAVSSEQAQLHYDIEKDVQFIGDFIRDYLTKNKRWNSPKFIAGESYGTLRACGLAQYLQSQHGIYLNGLILISCAIDFQTLQVGRSDHILSSILYLPTYATTNWYHKRNQSELSLKEVAQRAKKFAYQEYAPWLLQPQFLDRTEREALYQKLAFMTGIEEKIIRKLNGRIDDGTFLTQFFSDQKKILGRFDSRVSGDYSERICADPSFSQIFGIFAAGFQEYLQKELGKVENYSLFSEEANEKWNFQAQDRFLGYPNFMNRLQEAMVSNPQMTLFVGSGYFDVATPFAATEYCFEQIDLPDSYKKNIQMEIYEGGHMYYLNPDARKKFKHDLESYYINTLYPPLDNEGI